jgi:ubiquinone biosynthesis protein COQ4
MAHRLATLIDATRKALKDPNDTKQAFRIADSLSFGTAGRLLRRYRKTDVGAQRLRDRKKLLDTLLDRKRLEAMPDGSFGRAYLRFLDSEGITAEGLVQASVDGRETLDDPDQEFISQQLREMHDLWHTLSGYQGDLLGEVAVLAFSFAQLRHPGVGFLAALGLVLAPDAKIRSFIIDGFRRGRRATWLPAQDWERLLPLPLDQVRRQLHIEPVPAYEPVRAPIAA